MFGGDVDDGAKESRRTIIFSVLIGVAIVLLVVGSILTGNWIPMVMLVPIISVPILMFIMEAKGGGDTGGSAFAGPPSAAAQSLQNFGQCLFGSILSCFIGLPVVLLVTERIGSTNFGFWLGATAVCVAATIYYWASKNVS